MAFACTLWAQGRTITGTVTDAETGETVPGANVIEQGTTNGTTTDFDGKYSLQVPDGATLVVTFVGYAQQEVAIGNRSVIDVQLAVDVEQLAEVVVVGYGVQDKKEITSATVSLDAADFNVGNINDATTLLQGKVPGLSIYNKGGNPNANPTIRLRGISTVGQNTEPLVVVDGVIGASLNNVDPNDIESINVLKDGSAAAIYGSRGSSGVILVTTKSGKAGKVTASYNGYVAAATVLNEIDVMNRGEYLAAGGVDLGDETDWVDEVTRTGISHVHNVSVAGGSESTTYRLAANYRDIEGILEESGFEQINARANINHMALNDRLNLTFNMSMTNRESNFSFNEALRYAALYNPTAPIRFDNGSFFQAVLFDNFNPVAIIEQNTNIGKRRELNYNVKADFEIVEGLTWTANLAQQFTNNVNGEYYPSTSFFRGFNPGGQATRNADDFRFILFETYGTYDNSFGNVDLTVTAGYSFQEDEYERFNVTAGNFPSDALGFNILESSGDLVLGNRLIDINSEASPENRIIAFFGRVNLTFDNSIFFNASLRREGSSKLGPDNRWGTFPAFGLGVDLNNYLQLGGVSQLKVRAGYGVTGALPGPSGLSQDLWVYSLDAGGTVSFDRDGNTDLQWEQKAEFNFGVDFGLFDGRLSGAVDVYTRNITDFILERNVDVTVFPSGRRYENAGELKTSGAELSLNYDVLQTGPVTWNTGLLLSTYNTKLEDYINDEEMRANLGAPGQNGTNMIRVKVGEEIGQIWGPRFEGVDESNGAPTFADINGDGQVISDPAEALNPDADFEVLGSGLPTMELGWTNQLSIGRWDVNAFFRGAFGHSLVNTFRAFYEPIDPGAINSYNRVKSDKSVDGLEVAQYSSLYVEKADFFKLDNLTIGYNFNVSNNDFFSNARIYGNIQNAFVITNYAGIDPEPVLAASGPVANADAPGDADVLSPGIDRRNNYFTSRTFTIGVQVSF